MAALTLNLVQGSVSVDFSGDAARQLQSEISSLMQTFKVAAGSDKNARPKPKPNLEYRFSGRLFLECFCNPNIWPTPFAAKVLLTIRDENIRLTTEAELPQLIEDLNLYLEHLK
jgi:hypothetical protein